MSLPTSRNTTYEENKQVLARDLNALQDAIVGAQHGPLTVVFAGGTMVGDSDGPLDWTGSNWSKSAFNHGTAQFYVHIGIEVPVGSRILAWSAKLSSSVTTIRCSLNRNAGVGASTQIGTDQDGVGEPVTLGETLGTPFVTIADERYWILYDGVLNTSIGHTIHHCSITFDRL